MQSVLIVSLFFVPMWLVERLSPGRDWPSRPLWILRALLFNTCQIAVVFVGALTWDRYLPGVKVWSANSLSLVSGALLGYLAITFFYYWWHRARHEAPILWRILHQLHHSPQRLEVLTSFYKHPLEMLINGVLSSTILYVLLGASPTQAGLTVLLTGLAELFYHWNIKTPYWLGFLLQRPESHCVHHARNSHTKNYSDLPLWDMLFGTFDNPKTQQFDCGFTAQQELQVGKMLTGQLTQHETPNHAH